MDPRRLWRERIRTDETAAEFYGRWAGLYDPIARYTPGVATLRRRAVAACDLRSGDTVVELGCGTGANLPYLREAVGPEGTVVGVDLTGPVVERAHERYADDVVHAVRGDATRPPLAFEDVDAILATFVVGMLDRPADAVAEWCDLVGSGGRVVLANAARSDRWYAPPVNAVFRAIVVLSTPPTARLRYERDPTRRLDASVRTAHAALRERSSAVVDGTHLLGVVRLTGGRVA